MVKALVSSYSKIILFVVIAIILTGVFWLIFFGDNASYPVGDEQRPTAFSPQSQTPPQGSPVARPKYRILHVMSYHADWKWNQEQFEGFKEPLADLDVDYKIFEMDTKRHSSAEWKEKMGTEARNLIDTWKPDLVYINDDDAQQYVTRFYINQDIPFVFSAVNADPARYGFVGSKNITGVLERPHFAQSVELLKRIVPSVKKVVVVIDDSPMWDSVIQTMKEEASQLSEVEIIRWDTIYTFAEYQQKMKEYQSLADAIALIGIFGFKDDQGLNVPYQEVLKWTAENSRLPDFTFWDDRITYGTLCTVTVSGYEQGRGAGKIARGILVEGKSPASFPMQQTVKGQPYVSLARANKLGLAIDSDVLLTAQVIQKFAWEK